MSSSIQRPSGIRTANVTPGLTESLIGVDVADKSCCCLHWLFKRSLFAASGGLSSGPESHCCSVLLPVLCFPISLIRIHYSTFRAMQASFSVQHQQCLRSCSRPSLRLLPARQHHLRMLSRAAASTQADEVAADKVGAYLVSMHCPDQPVLLVLTAAKLEKFEHSAASGGAGAAGGINLHVCLLILLIML